MKAKTKQFRPESERGVALVIAIFTMLLISVVATVLILTAGTASALKTNYKSSMQAFYDAKAGLEEGRSRLWSGNPNCLVSVNPACTGSPVTATPCVASPMPTNQVCYITNPAAGETIDPTNVSDPYYDSEYNSEFGPGALGAANVTQMASNSVLAKPNVAGPLYKWVRITARTGQSAGVNVDGSTGSDTNPLFFCVPEAPLSASSSYCQDTQPHEWPFTGVGAPGDGLSTQVFSVSALGVTPGGFSGRRLLQYTVAENPDPLGQPLTDANGTPSVSQIFQAALTLDGSAASFSGSVPVSGIDGSAPSGSNAGVPAIACPNGTAVPTCSGCSAPTGMQAVQNVTLPSLMLTPPGLDRLVKAITQEASAVITPPAGTVADDGSLPSTLSASNPMIVVVNGDFHLSHGHGSSGYSGTGSGLLLVTGQLNYDPDDIWNGIIMVIGKGIFTNNGQHGTNGAINGVLFIANIYGDDGNLLNKLGTASYTQTGGGKGIRYDSGQVKSVESLTPYQVLSFREIPLAQ